jgi:hypothetical protein
VPEIIRKSATASTVHVPVTMPAPLAAVTHPIL